MLTSRHALAYRGFGFVSHNTSLKTGTRGRALGFVAPLAWEEALILCWGFVGAVNALMEVKDDSRAFDVTVMCVKEVEEYYFLSPRRLDSSLVVLFY